MTGNSSPTSHPGLTSWGRAIGRDVARRSQQTSLDELDRDPRTPAYVPKAPRLPKPTKEEAARNLETAQLWLQLMGRNTASSFLGTGIDPARIRNKQGEVRDLILEAGLREPETIERLLDAIEPFNLGFIRTGVPMSMPPSGPLGDSKRGSLSKEEHARWRAADALTLSLAKRGYVEMKALEHFEVSDDLLTIEDGKPVLAKSYHLHPRYPEIKAERGLAVYQRYRDHMPVLTVTNEPEVTAGFNGEMWHGGFPGWSSPEFMRYYLRRAVQIATAEVATRSAIENYELSLPEEERRKPLFLHNDAMVAKLSWPEFDRFIRFMVGDLSLGHRWFLEWDLGQLDRMSFDEMKARWDLDGKPIPEQWTERDWFIYAFAFRSREAFATEPELRTAIADLKRLQALHASLPNGVTMTTRTVLGVDYYNHNEDKSGAGEPLDPHPIQYGAQVREGKRAGKLNVITDYSTRYGSIPIVIAETGTPFPEHAVKYHRQSILEAEKAARAGIHVLGYTIYPVRDVQGWGNALTRQPDPELKDLEHAGIVDRELRPYPWMGELVSEMRRHLPDAPRPRRPRV